MDSEGGDAAMDSQILIGQIQRRNLGIELSIVGSTLGMYNGALIGPQLSELRCGPV